MTAIPIKKGDIAVGYPLAWSLFDKSGKLLLRRGYVLESQHQLDTLHMKGLYRNTGAGAERSADSETGPEPEASGNKGNVCRLDEIKLQIGDTLQMQSQSEQGGPRYYVKLIGYLPGKSVIVTTPLVDGKIALMREGQNFVVRCFSGKNAYAFPASTFKVVNTPYPHLHLSYPREVRGLVVRKGARVHTNLIAAVKVLSGVNENSQAAASVVNLSVGGALLAAKAPLGEKGDRVSLTFRVSLEEIEAFPVLEAVIRSITTEPMTEAGGLMTVHHGLEFRDIAQEDRVMLTAFVYQQLLEDSGGG